jgi:endonuclease/exonuclease/phosphatase (EEP) superfamily protein YafD
MPPPTVRETRFRRFFWPSWTTRKRLMVREAWLLVLVSYPAIGFAYLWPTSLRDTRQWFVMAAWSAFMIRTFLFHAGLVYALIALSAMFSRRRRLALACLPLLPVCLGPTLLEYLPRKSAPVKGETLTVMTVNLMMVNRNTESMIQEIQAARPDVLLLQEYTDKWHTALRFDRIFLSPALTAVESRVGVGQGSDHRPVIARIGLRRD